MSDRMRPGGNTQDGQDTGQHEALPVRRTRARRRANDEGPGPDWVAFGQRVVSWHQIVPHDTAQLAMCSCQAPARLCGYVNAAHQYLGMPVPWDPPTQQPGH